MTKSKTKTIKRHIIQGLDYLLFAGVFAMITYFYWFSSAGIMVIAYIQNVVGISSALIIDKIRLRRIYKKIESCKNDEERAKWKKKNVTSLKTSLYLFYIFALMFSQLLALGAPIYVSDNMRGYFQSVGYGVVLLFAIDNFFGYLISDNERVKKFKEKYK